MHMRPQAVTSIRSGRYYNCIANIIHYYHWEMWMFQSHLIPSFLNGVDHDVCQKSHTQQIHTMCWSIIVTNDSRLMLSLGQIQDSYDSENIYI